MKINRELFKIKIIDLHIARSFLIPLFTGLFFFVFFFNLIEIIDRIPFYSDHNIPLHRILIYQSLRSPFMMIQMIPLATLFATILSLANLHRTKQTTALLTAGTSFYRIIRPLIISGMILFFMVLIYNNTVVPRATLRASQMNRQFRNRSERFMNIRLYMYGKNNAIYSVQQFNSQTDTIDGLNIIYRDKEGVIIKRIDADSAQWLPEEKKWDFSKLSIRIFESNRQASIKEYERHIMELPETPVDFGKESREINQMTMKESWRHIMRLKHGGAQYGKEMVEFNWKISFPFGIIIMILLGAPLSTMTSKNILITSALFSFLGAIIYYILLTMGFTLGKNEMLNPLLAAWLGNIIFMGVIYILFRKVRT